MKLPQIYEKILHTIEKYRMLGKSRRIIVALSGGPDSVLLLHSLYSLREKLGIELSTIHVHHMSRGSASDEDAKFCRDLTEKLGIEHIEVKKDVVSIAKEQKLSFEEAGRIVRFEEFKKAAQMTGAGRVATGHTKDDQAETVLMHLISGTGKKGAAGIYPVYEKFIIRPLIELRKKEILSFLKESDISYRIDATNQDTAFYRNKIRNYLLPIIEKEFNPQITDALSRFSDISREEIDFISEHTKYYSCKYIEEIPGGARLKISPLTSLKPYMLKHILRETVAAAKGSLKDLTFYHTEQLFELLKKPTGSKTEIPGGFIAEREYDYLAIKPSSIEEPQALPQVALEIPGNNIIPEWNITINGSLLDNVPSNFAGVPHAAYFDADKIGEGNFILRSRKDGDRFRPFGLKGEKKLKEFFIDEKIPRARRDSIPIIEKDGRIIWVAGIRQADDFRVNKDSKRVLKLQIENLCW